MLPSNIVSNPDPRGFSYRLLRKLWLASHHFISPSVIQQNNVSSRRKTHKYVEGEQCTLQQSIKEDVTREIGLCMGTNENEGGAGERTVNRCRGADGEEAQLPIFYSTFG